MVANFADPAVGCVGWRSPLREGAGEHVGRGPGALLGLRAAAPRRESQGSTRSSASRAASTPMRKSLYVPAPSRRDQRLRRSRGRDVAGISTVLEPRALAFERSRATRSAKSSTGARGTRAGSAARSPMPDLLNPVRHPWFATLLWSHRVLRWLVPCSCSCLAASSPLASHGRLFRLVLAGSSRSTAPARPPTRSSGGASGCRARSSRSTSAS
jgi:hypothetical protein